MNRDICLIEITFENTDFIKIPAHYFRDFVLEDVRTVVRRAAANAILRYFEANSVLIELEPEANRDGKTFEGDVHIVHYGNNSLFERLQQNDITAIKLIYADDTEESFYVVWEDEDESGFRNLFQSSTVDEDGIICVKIAAEPK